MGALAAGRFGCKLCRVDTLADDPVMAEIAAAAAGAIRVRADAGDVLFRPEDPCRGFIAVRSGVIRVGLTSAAGRELILYRVRPGQVCLQTFVCLAEHRTYSAEGVAETAVEGVLLPPPLFEQLLTENTRFRSSLLISVAERFGDLEDMVQALAFAGLPKRLATGLLALRGKSDSIEVTHEALAAEIGSAREAVSRQLSVMARDGLVSLSRSHILLVDIAGIERLAKGP